MTLIIFFSKILVFLLKLTGKGEGTALPGLIIERHFPWVFKRLLDQVPTKIAITGTNGKTTTQTILRSILKEANYRIITNKAGANLKRGLLSELLKHSNIFGRINSDIAVFEVEEATLPKVIEDINPQILIITNLFRDQLDAYGEIDITAKYIQQAVDKLPELKVIKNGDDPHVSTITANNFIPVHLSPEFARRVKYESFKALNHSAGINNHSVKATDTFVQSSLSTKFSVEADNFSLKNLELRIPGFFHLYNALYAITAAKLLNIEDSNIRSGVENAEPAFGRGEILTRKGQGFDYKIRMLLVKNPAGFNLNLKLLEELNNLKLMFIINDKIADGKDVSWLWDVDFEMLNNFSIKTITCSGHRAKDMALRLKYALKTKDIKINVEEDIHSALKSAENYLSENETLFVLPTYTALLEFRKILGLRLE